MFCTFQSTRIDMPLPRRQASYNGNSCTFPPIVANLKSSIIPPIMIQSSFPAGYGYHWFLIKNQMFYFFVKDCRNLQKVIDYVRKPGMDGFRSIFSSARICQKYSWSPISDRFYKEIPYVLISICFSKHFHFCQKLQETTNIYRNWLIL